MPSMDFRFSADGGHHRPPISDSADGGLHRPPISDSADGDLHRPPFPDPTGGGSHHRPLLPIPTASGGYHRPPLPNTAAGYFPAPMHATFQPNQIPPPPQTFPTIPSPRSTGFPGDAAARNLRKAQIRAEILAGESNESRLLEEEVRRELYFERCMAERLREVERLGPSAPASGNETPLREIERSITGSLRQLQSFDLMLPSPVVEPIQAPNYMDFWPGNMPSHPISHRPEAWVGEMPPPDSQIGERPLPYANFHPTEAWVGEMPPPVDNPQVGERPLSDANFHPSEVWVGEPPPPDANSHSLVTRVGEKRSRNNLSDIGLALRPPGDSDIGVQHESEMVPKPKRDRAAKQKLAEIKIKKKSGRKAPATTGNCFQCGQPGHRRANCPASKEEVANYKVPQQTDENGAVEEDGAANDKCSRCGQSGHSRANCHVSEEEAEWYKFTQEISDTDEGEVSEAHAPPVNDNCFHCGEVGHQRANCPLSREAKRQKNSQQMRWSNHICHWCGKIGHMSSECWFLKRHIRRAENMKHKVLVNGVDPAPRFGGKCFICGQSGHLRKQCPASREKVARFEDSFLGKKGEKKKRKKEKKAGL